MWQTLYLLASPKWFYQQSALWVRFASIPVFLLLMIGLTWGLFFSPMDYQQKEAFRIIYVHVPAAFMSLFIYGFISFMSVLVLVWRIKMAGIMLQVAPIIGASMTGLALATGSLWGKPMWGTWWVWDARLTSELILLFLYIMLLSLRSVVGNHERGDKLVSILCLVGCLDLPIIHYSVYWWNSLHQGATLSIFHKPKMENSMLMPLLINLTAYGLYCALAMVLRARTVILARFCNQKWVQGLKAQEL